MYDVIQNALYKYVINITTMYNKYYSKVDTKTG